MIDIAIFLALGAFLSVVVLIFAPLWLVYAAAYVALTPVIAAALFFGRGLPRSFARGLWDVFRNMLRPRAS